MKVYAFSHDSFISRQSRRSLRGDKLHPKKLLHCGDLKEITFVRYTEAAVLYRFIPRISWRRILHNYTRRRDIFSRDERDVRATEWWSPPNEPPMTLTVMRRAHDRPGWTRSLTSPIATLLSRPDRPGIATNHVKLVIRCVIRVPTFVYLRSITHWYLDWFTLWKTMWSIHVSSSNTIDRWQIFLSLSLPKTYPRVAITIHGRSGCIIRSYHRKTLIAPV